MIKWPELLEGKLIKRYKRFIADVKLKNGHVVSALCPNTGSMTSCSEPGRTVYISRHFRPERKLKYTWEMIEMPTSLVGVNTGIPNKLVKESIKQKKVPQLLEFDRIRSEVKYGSNSRIDILLERGNEKCFIEIKNCTLMENGVCYFPDAVTSRGLKHLQELQREVISGNRAVMFYLVQRMDVETFKPAAHIDPAYAKELKKAHKNGVEILVYDVIIDTKSISINRQIPFRL